MRLVTEQVKQRLMISSLYNLLPRLILILEILGCYYVQITLLKVRFNLFFDLSYSILVNYLERIIQMSGRKLSSQMNIVCTVNIITIA